ncbi:ATP-binding protein [Cohnella sp. GCM10027633]|uniref:ATP-binding protein n=1 Tax=unclassified Cohnella TaxID=2636738 RepID=UPI003626160A
MTRESEQATDVIRLTNSLGELDRLHEFFETCGTRFGWPAKLNGQLVLSCDELLTNTISYGYPQGGEHAIVLSVRSLPDVIEVTLEDEGIPFNPLLKDDPDITLGLDEREIGGLGLMFVKRLMDELHYERTDTGNRLRMVKRL